MSALPIVTSIGHLFNRLSGGCSNPPLSQLTTAWKVQLDIVADHATIALDQLKSPSTPNELVRRYVVMDLLDILAAQKVVSHSPFDDYVELTGSFDDHFKYAWKDLSDTVFVGDRDTQRRACAWGRAVYDSRGFASTDENINWGMRIWEAQPSLIVGPSPTSWEVALPRLMAHVFTDSMWAAAQAPVQLHKARELLQEFITVQLPPLQAVTVQWRRIRHHGIIHLACLLTTPERSEHPDLISARFAWMQTCIYYALIRGKLDRVSSTSHPSSADMVLRALDTSLKRLITLLISEVNP